MTVHIRRTELEELLPLRALFLEEANVQIRYNACHERGWSDAYIIEHNGTKVGYGAVKGAEHISDRDAVFEFYLLPPYRHLSNAAFELLLATSGASIIECQTNEPLLTSLLYEYAHNIVADTILFADNTTTFLTKEAVAFRKRQQDDPVFAHKREPVGEYVLVQHNEILATGGFALYYNLPFADLYLEVKEEYQGKGLGTYLLQELKKECYRQGRVPAARCSIENAASKAALIKAGFKIAGYMLKGRVAHAL